MHNHCLVALTGVRRQFSCGVRSGRPDAEMKLDLSGDKGLHAPKISISDAHLLEMYNGVVKILCATARIANGLGKSLRLFVFRVVDEIGVSRMSAIEGQRPDFAITGGCIHPAKRRDIFMVGNLALQEGQESRFAIIVRQPEDSPKARAPARQGQHESRLVRRCTLVADAEAERPAPAIDNGAQLFQVIEGRFPEQ